MKLTTYTNETNFSTSLKLSNKDVVVINPRESFKCKKDISIVKRKFNTIGKWEKL